MLAYNTHWQGMGDPLQRWKLMEAATKLYDKAVQHNAITHFQNPLRGPTTVPFGRAEYYAYRAYFFETDPEKRIELLNMAEEDANEALKIVRNSDMPGPISGALHTLSNILKNRARLDLDLTQKRKRLKKAIEYGKENINIQEQLWPFDYYDLGLAWSGLAEIKAAIAEVESNRNKRRRLLQEAVMLEERGIDLCAKMIPYYERVGIFEYIHVFGVILDRCATMLTNLHDLTKQSENLRRAIEMLHVAIKSAKKEGIISLEAESYWKIGKAYDILEEHLEAAENFEQASRSYLKVAEKLPQLKDFYENHAFYMQAWSEIEKAKAAHAKEQYVQAKTHYERAAILHKSTTQWNYYSSNYLAWALLEAAEELSRSEKPEEAIENFQKAVELFEKAGKLMRSKLETSLSREEKELADALFKASEKRGEYCLGRIALEEARIQDRKGDHLQSSRKYGLAAKIFEKMAKEEEGQSRKQLLPLSYLCQAWQKMMLGEATMSSEAYEEAAELFKQAREHSLDQKASLLALANGRFCKALASGTEFEITRNLEAYSEAKTHMEAAENCYLKAGYGPAAEYAKATLTLLDAYMYTTRAETETQPTDKAKYYNMAERTLRASVDSYLRAKYPEKSAEVQRLLENVAEKRELTVSMITVLSEPIVTATTRLFSAPTPTHEQAVGSERFEHAELEGNLAIPGEATVEEQIEVKLDIVNVGREPGLLLRVQGIIPPCFKVVSSSPQLKIEGDLIDMKGKRIEPLKVDLIELCMQTMEAGIFNLKPQIVYVDEVGSFKQCFLKPATLTVYPKLELEFRTTAAQKVFDYLVKSFVEDYMKRKLVLQVSGWRSYVQIIKNVNISSRKIYGSRGASGSAISELQRRGLIETRILLGERGRGGRITKTRICYEKEVVKRLVDHKVAKNE
jgi:tetratricopeptide (TPR) repeat protein